MAGEEIFFDQIRSSGCLSYILGCKQDHVCVVIDPEIDKADDYVELARFFGSTVLYAIDTHTHADHNSACKVMRERYGTQVVMHRATEAPYVDLRVGDGDEINLLEEIERTFAIKLPTDLSHCHTVGDLHRVLLPLIPHAERGGVFGGQSVLCA